LGNCDPQKGWPTVVKNAILSVENCFCDIVLITGMSEDWVIKPLEIEAWCSKAFKSALKV